MRAALLLLSCAACVVPPEEREHDRPAGSPCSAASECASLSCGAGTCTGGTCDCNVLRGCPEEGAPDPDCEDGWLCVEANIIGQITFTGSCRLACSRGCPSGWMCEDGKWCLYRPPPPTVMASSDKTTVGLGETVAFSASATSQNGPVERYFWDFKDGDTAEGASLEHAFTRTGRFPVEVTAEDSIHALGSRSIPIEVCNAEGVSCPEQSGCCGELYCLQDMAGTYTFTCGVCAEEARPCNINQGGDRQCCGDLRCLPSAPNETACLSCRPDGAPCSPSALGQCCEGLACRPGPGLGDFCEPR